MSEKCLIVSLDYELFFGANSGTVENCLLKPGNALLNWASKQQAKLTLYVDAGMLVKMGEYAAAESTLQAEYDAVRRNIGAFADAGHEIGLHVHPHWHDTTRSEGQWQFSGTRYSLREFNDNEIVALVEAQADALGAVAGQAPKSYRAGGFCVQPFERIAPALDKVGISIDSSVVPGMSLDDSQKGFDFSGAPTQASWRFADDPLKPDSSGRFIEVPVNSARLSRTFYWGRLIDRLAGRSTANSFGDGSSKGISGAEVLKRLFAAPGVTELSVDAAKTALLQKGLADNEDNGVCHVMGHPKLISGDSLQALAIAADANGVGSYLTVAEAARQLAQVASR